MQHIKSTVPAGAPFVLAPVASGKTLLERVEERGKRPDTARRWYTGDHKRTPIERGLRRYLKTHPRFGGQVVTCLGIRRDASAARSKRSPWSRNERNSRAGREWFHWLPIFDTNVVSTTNGLFYSYFSVYP